MCVLDFARLCEFPLGAPQAGKRRAHRSRTFGAAWCKRRVRRLRCYVGGIASRSPRGAHRRGTTEVSTNGGTANFLFLDRGTFWAFPLTYFRLPKSARAYLFPNQSKIHDFCSGPITFDPICPRPSPAGARRKNSRSKNPRVDKFGDFPKIQ